MSSLHHKDDFFIAEYTLGLLEPDEIAQAHALLGADDDAVVCALQWEARLLELTDALTPLHPPDALLGRIHATLGLPRNPAPLRQPSKPQPDFAAPAAPDTPAALPKESPKPAPPKANPTHAAPRPDLRAPPAEPRPSAGATSVAESSMPMDFEPRLIRPDTSAAQPSRAAQAGSAASASAGTEAARTQPWTRPDPAAPASPARVRNAPPDPTETFRREAASRRPARKSFWRSLWFWRTLSAALAILAAVLVLPKNTFRHDPALNASVQQLAAPTPHIMQVAIMQAPGLSSTPGWILTVDDRQNVVLAPQVDILVPESESVYLWTYNEQSPHPRLLGAIDPTRPLTLPMEVTGEVAPGQIFEMTQEPNLAPPREPDGPILFIGRTVSLG